MVATCMYCLPTIISDNKSTVMLSIGHLGSKHLPDELHSHAHTQRYTTSDEPEQLFMGCVQMQYELLKKKKKKERKRKKERDS